MIAFKNTTETKAKILARVKRHRKLDELVKGTYGDDYGKGCAVSCSMFDKIPSDPLAVHAMFPSIAGVPEEIAYLQDAIFEGLPSADSAEWPERFWNSVQEGSDLSLVAARFKHWLLTDILQYADAITRTAIQTVIELLARQIEGDNPTQEEWKSAARAAAWSAESAALSAALSAAWSAESAAWSAKSAARAAESAESAKSAARAAKSAARAAESAAWSAAYQPFADKLCELLREAPIVNGDKL